MLGIVSSLNVRTDLRAPLIAKLLCVFDLFIPRKIPKANIMKVTSLPELGRNPTVMTGLESIPSVVKMWNMVSFEDSQYEFIFRYSLVHSLLY
jgi:hypothetical protein